MALNDFLKNLKIGDDYDDEDDDDFDVEEDYSEDDVPAKEKKAPKGRKPFFNNSSDRSNINIIHTNNDVIDLKVHAICPSDANNLSPLAPAQELADVLKSGSAVLINFENVSIDLSQRMLDFISGVAYYAEANLNQVSQNVYVCTPKVVPLSGVFMSDLANAQKSFTDDYQRYNSFNNGNNY